MENDFFRRNKAPLSEGQLLKVDLIKCEAEKLLVAMTPSSELIDPRCLSIAKTKLEESVMWAIKGFTNYDDRCNLRDSVAQEETKNSMSVLQGSQAEQRYDEY